MISPARTTAFAILQRIEFDSAYSDEVLNSRIMDRLSPPDRNLVLEIVYGTLRWQLTLDYVVEEAADRPVMKIDRAALVLLRMSLYQLRHMNRIPDHAVVNDAVELAKALKLKRGLTGFINGVLRSLCRSRPWESDGFLKGAPPWVAVSLPKWLWLRWSDRFGADTAVNYALSLNLAPRASYRLKQEAVEGYTHPAGANPSEIVPGALFLGSIANPAGYRIQDEASQLVPQLIGPMPGGRAWDACAAPGGKSEILKELCAPGGFVVSSDIRFRRARHMASRIRDGWSACQSAVLVADAAQPAPFRISFDAVLADVPCSGLGTLRRNPEIKWRFDPADLPRLAENQSKVLRSASEQVRQGGSLVYSTCSTEPEENEWVVGRFLETNTAYRLVIPQQPAGISAWLDERGFLRTFPSARLWDGFFAAIMVRLP